MSIPKREAVEWANNYSIVSLRDIGKLLDRALESFACQTAGRTAFEVVVVVRGILLVRGPQQDEDGQGRQGPRRREEGHEGRGYATEAAMAMRDWAMRALRLAGLVSYVHPENHRSAAVAERLGATLDADAPKQDPDDLVYRHLPVG